MREHTIITISRQYGSGGREIAEILAKKMKVRCYDRQIVYLAAEKSEMEIWMWRISWRKHTGFHPATVISSQDLESETISFRIIIKCIKSRLH